MDSREIQQLLSQPENTTLEFKRKLYSIDDRDLVIREKQRAELIKDVLSLANGNAASVGEQAYLIIGVEDKLPANGQRKLHDIDPTGWTTQQVLHIVNSACAPPLQDIICEPIELDGNWLLVITIWPTPHLHETTRELITAKSTYSKYTVFSRHNENIAIASAKEREAILKLKQFYFADTRKAPPSRFGAVVGALVGGFIAVIPPDKKTKPKKEISVGRAIGGSILGAPLGALIGWLFTGFADLKYEWNFASKRGRVVGTVALIGYMVMMWQVLKWLRQRLPALFVRPEQVIVNKGTEEK
jgi:hypothetical protein